MRAITIIKNEHKSLDAALFTMEQLIGEIDAGKHPEFAAFHGLFTYVDRFLDRYHHPKENDFLFPKLLERAPETAELVALLGEQHHEGELLFVDMLKALSAYEFTGDAEYPQFRDRVLGYVEFERQHARTEEQEILPRARAALTPADWEQIDAAFDTNRDPMFGAGQQSEFSRLLNDLVNRLPAPLGLGEKWK